VAILVSAGLAGVLVLCCGGVTFVAYQMFRSSDVYRLAVERAVEHPPVRQRLGEPIEPGWLMEGEIHIRNDEGEATLRIPINGPKGTAQVLADAVRAEGEWRFHYLAVEFDDPAERFVLEGDRPPPALE